MKVDEYRKNVQSVYNMGIFTVLRGAVSQDGQMLMAIFYHPIPLWDAIYNFMNFINICAE